MFPCAVHQRVELFGNFLALSEVRFADAAQHAGGIAIAISVCFAPLFEVASRHPEGVKNFVSIDGWSHVVILPAVTVNDIQ